MPRVRKGAARAQARKRILRKARGYFGTRHSHKYLAENAVIRAGVYRFRDRRRVKRDMRRLWITRITAACRMRGARYSQFMNGLKLAGIALNRKMLSEVAIEDPKLFDSITATAIKAAGGSGVKAAGDSGPTRRASAMVRSTSGAGATAPKAGGSPGGGDIIKIEGIGPAFRAKLQKAGVSWIRELLKAGATKAGRQELTAKADIPEKKILDWVNMADMMRVKGVDGDMAELMHAAGVDTVKELATRVPGNLATKMGEVNAAGAKSIAPRVPDEKEVAGWIEQAKKLPPVVEH